jgi:hypothetical protein
MTPGGVDVFIIAAIAAATTVACATSPNAAPEAQNDAGSEEAAARFGSHAPCDASVQCSDGEACGFAIVLGCSASGECVTGSYYCNEHAKETWCNCAGVTSSLSACMYFMPSYYAPFPVQAQGACPGDDSGTACDGAAAGEPCDAAVGQCCNSYCALDRGTCCLIAYQPCTNDTQCCGRKCSSENASFGRCL